MSEAHAAGRAILFVDDEATAVKYFQRAIGALAPVLTAGSVEEGRQVLDANAGQIAVLVSDQRMPGACGNELLIYARDRYPHMVRILTTAYSELDYTVEAVNQGEIHRYIQKPWEIAALRMELKQALALAELRADHARLAGEKLQVGQKQLLAGRIGALHMLCASLLAPDQRQAPGAYLAAANAARVRLAAPDWRVLDYADMVAAEAYRSAELRDAVEVQLARMERLHPYSEPAVMLELLASLLAGTRGDDGTLLLADARVLAEFLEAPTQVPVSPQHAGWIAGLLWLCKRGWTVQAASAGTGVACRLQPVASALQPRQLAAWIEQF
jgi:two-component system probable response regulator PhcQ